MAPRKTTTSKASRPSFLEYPGNCSHLSIRHRLESQPPGLKTMLTLSSRAALFILRGIDSIGGLRITVSDPTHFPFNQIDVNAGDQILAESRYSFYCDPFSIESARTILGLLCSGNPSDGERPISPGFRILTSRPVIQTNLLIVPDNRFNHWMELLKESFLTVTYIRSTPDLLKLTDQKKVLSRAVLLLSSKLYPDFADIYEKTKVRWARIIVEEHEKNPMDRDSRHLSAERWCFLVNGFSPSTWISSPERGARFAHVGAVLSETSFPELFYVRNDPSFIKMCHKSAISRTIFPSMTPLIRKIGTICLNHTFAQHHIAASVQHRHWTTDVILCQEIEAIHHDGRNQIGRARLECSLLIGRILETHDGNHPVTIGTVKRIYEQLNHTIYLINENMKKNIDVLAAKRREDGEILMSAYQSDHLLIEESGVSRTNQAIDAHLENDQKGERSILPPVLICFISEKTPPTAEEISQIRQDLPVGYHLIEGKASGHKVFCPCREARQFYLVLGVSSDLFVCKYSSGPMVGGVLSDPNGISWTEGVRTPSGVPGARSEKVRRLADGPQIEIEYLLVNRDETFQMSLCQDTFFSSSHDTQTFPAGTRIVL